MKQLRIKILLSLILLVGCNDFCFAQDFANPHLDGTISGISSLPDEWENVSALDPACEATGLYVTDTPDLTSVDLPNLSSGVAATPYIGNTCLTGGHSINIYEYTYIIWHEGIQQTVYGLNPGTEYEISFYQAVVKQKDVESESGYWKVYRDYDLIGHTSPTTSDLHWSDVNVEWEYRSMRFLATLDSHTFKFLPTTKSVPRKVRMGIDNIHLTCPIPELREDTTICYGHKVNLNVEVENGTYLWNDGNTDPVRIVSEPGTYTVTIDNGCSVKTDSVKIDTINCPVIIKMPNVFSPNGDGINDGFAAIKINEIQQWNLVITNRWGVVVFSTTDPFYAWDGKFNGESCVNGVYYWSISAIDSFGELQKRHGTVSLLR